MSNALNDEGGKPRLGTITKRMDIYKKILEGWSTTKVVEAITNNQMGWDRAYSRRHALRLISGIRNDMIENFNSERDNIIQENYERLLDIYKESREDKDRYNAISSLKEINKMTGAYQPQKIDLNVSGEIEIDFDL